MLFARQLLSTVGWKNGYHFSPIYTIMRPCVLLPQGGGMWQHETTGCGVRSAMRELMAFSDRARRALTYRRRHEMPDVENTSRPLMVAASVLAAKAFYDKGSPHVHHGVMIVGQLFVYVGPGLYLSWEPINDFEWRICVAHLNEDGSVDDDLPVPLEIQGKQSYRWQRVPGPTLDTEVMPAGRFGENHLHE